VADLVDLPKGKEGRKSRSLTLEQAQAVLIEAVKPEHRIGAYVILAIVSGLRTEELRVLRWSDVDLDSATVYVIRADRHQGNTKTELSRRGLGIADIAIEALSTLRKQQAAEKLKAGEAYQDQDLVFCHKDGSPYDSKAIYRRFRKITTAAGVGDDWRPRELRHTFVSILSDHDVPTQKISDLVGHKDTKITERVYRHQLKPVIRDGAEHMNDIFKNKINKSA
jgi:integrase